VGQVRLLTKYGYPDAEALIGAFDSTVLRRIGGAGWIDDIVVCRDDRPEVIGTDEIHRLGLRK
jgi:hypothetical protein